MAFILYMLSFIIGALGFSLLGLDFESAIGVAASSLGNVGPALGEFGPSFSFYAMPVGGKLLGLFSNAAWTLGTIYGNDLIYPLLLEENLIFVFTLSTAH